MGSGGGSQGEPGVDREPEAAPRPGFFSVMRTWRPHVLPQEQPPPEDLGHRAFCGWLQGGPCRQCLQKGSSKTKPQGSGKKGLQKGSGKKGLAKRILLKGSSKKCPFKKGLLIRPCKKSILQRVKCPPQRSKCPGDGQQPNGKLSAMQISGKKTTSWKMMMSAVSW